MSASLDSILTAASQLAPEEQKVLVEKLMEQFEDEVTFGDVDKQTGLDIVRSTRGTIKGLDRETIISFAEDEEYSGY